MARPPIQPMAQEDFIDDKIEKLRIRIKNTSSTRFNAAKRVRFNYNLGNLTIIVLSFWEIALSLLLIKPYIPISTVTKDYVEATTVLLPVFIVVFSLIEGGGNYLRSHLLELNARQLRELADEYAAAASKNAGHRDTDAKAELFGKYSDRYNSTLERSPINHDDVDHFGFYYGRWMVDSAPFSPDWFKFSGLVLFVWARRQFLRLVYLFLWFVPLLVLLAPPLH